MKTERLYYQDAYLRSFTAHISAARTVEGRSVVALDRSAFYPTGGGQPCDGGTLGGLIVVDVATDGDLIWHTLDGALAEPVEGREVQGVVDWERRFDHMQQHTGQHVLSEALIKTYDAATVAFHLGVTTCTIDLNRTNLDAAALAQVEAAANAVIDAALPVHATFVDDATLARLPLRKAPNVEGAVRIVEVEGYDWSPCGGTHVANSAQIGLIKITGTERRGAELRVSFLCGGRARRDYARLQILAEALVGRFTTGQGEVLAAVDRQADENRLLRKDLAGLETDWAAAQAAALWAGAAELGHWRVVVHTFDCPVDRAKRVAQALREQPGAAVFLGVRGERPQLLFTRADEVALNAGELLKAAAAAGGGRGGGRPDWAQGGVPTNDGLAVALAAARARVEDLARGNHA